VASQNPFPLMPPKSTELRLMHFDEYVYTGDNSTILYKLVDALCGTVGAGQLVNEIFLARMAGALETIYFNDLDYIFGRVSFLVRSPAESYSYNPQTDMLTADQWSEIRIKDAWYRARIRDFFTACTMGGTPDGIRMTVQAAVATDADIFEVWRYRDNFGLTEDLGRSPTTEMWAAVDLSTGQQEVFSTYADAFAVVSAQDPGTWQVQLLSARNEVVIKPHKSTLAPVELRLLRDMLEKIVPMETVVTVDPNGLAVMSPVPVSAAAADSTYFEVQRMVTATPALDTFPPPELLPIDLLPTEQWLFLAKDDPQLAPYTAFNISAESSYFYLVGGGKRSPIDSVTYGTLQSDGKVRTEPNYQVYDSTGSFTPKQPYERADCPQNYPGGKFGLHPASEPARNPDNSPYIFPFASQAAYVAQKALEVVGLGGRADPDGFSLPIRAESSSARTFWPEYAIAYAAPTQDSTVSASYTRRRGDRSRLMAEIRDPRNFVRV
jgi:hypothetical protein